MACLAWSIFSFICKGRQQSAALFRGLCPLYCGCNFLGGEYFAVVSKAVLLWSWCYIALQSRSCFRSDSPLPPFSNCDFYFYSPVYIRFLQLENTHSTQQWHFCYAFYTNASPLPQIILPAVDIAVALLSQCSVRPAHKESWFQVIPDSAFLKQIRRFFLATTDTHLTGRRPEQAFLEWDLIDGEWTARSCLGKTALFVSGHKSTQGVVCWVRGLFRSSIRGWFGASFPHFSCQGSLSAWWVRTVWSASESPSLPWAGGGCLL